MKKIILVLFIIINLQSYSQTKNTSVEKSFFGVQTGILGVYFHNESKLSDKIALKSEIGLDFGIIDGFLIDKTCFLTPVIQLEPRFYYNLNKRLENSKTITKNSGNYISVKLNYNPDWFLISNTDDINTLSQFRIVPSWGIKRTYGKHFTLETGAGLGLSFIDFNPTLAILNLHFRIGYTF